MPSPIPSPNIVSDIYIVYTYTMYLYIHCVYTLWIYIVDIRCVHTLCINIVSNIVSEFQNKTLCRSLRVMKVLAGFMLLEDSPLLSGPHKISHHTNAKCSLRAAQHQH